jgi:tetratricopeptide (TPR) repeat protein
MTQLNKFEDALILLEKSVRQNPRLLPARFNLAKLLLEFKNDPQKAKTHLNAALNFNPTANQRQVLRDYLVRTNSMMFTLNIFSMTIPLRN